MSKDHDHGGKGCGNCGKNDCDCSCKGSTTFDIGCACADFNRSQTVTGQDAKIADNVQQVDVCGDEPVTLTLPSGPRFARSPLIINNRSTENVTIEGDRNIEGQDEDGEFTLAPGQSAIFTFGRCDDDDGKCGSWSVLLGLVVGDGDDGDGDQLIVPDIAALVALNCSELKEGTRVLVQTLDGFWGLALTSTAPTDGITIVAAQCGGRWLRVKTFSKKWALQLLWFVDPANGNDENVGSSVATAVKTVAEVGQRLAEAEAGKVVLPAILGVNDSATGGYQVKILNDVPLFESTPRPFGTVLISDRMRFSWLQNQNPEDVNTAGGAIGFEQTFNATVFGVRTLSASRAFTAATVRTAGNVQYTVQDTGQNWSAHLGEFILITNAAGAQSTAAIGADLGGGNARISQPRRVSDGGTDNAVLVGASYQFITLTKWNPPLIQNSNSQGRYGVQNLEFPPAAGPPATAEQSTITFRYSSLTFTTCRFRRFVDVSNFSGPAFNGCSLDFHGLNPAGIVPVPPFAGTVVSPTDSNTIVDHFLTGSSVTACLYLNADVRLVFGSTISFNACYFQRSTLATVTVSGFITYGFFSVGAGTSGAYINVFGATNTAGQADGTGIGLFDWPVVGTFGVGAGTDSAVRISDRSFIKMITGANLYGTGAGVGLRVQGGSGFLWGTAGATQPTITGVAFDLILENSPTAIPSPELAPTSWAPPVQSPLTTWTEWAAPVGLPGASGFARKAMNYQTGSFISQAVS